MAQKMKGQKTYTSMQGKKIDMDLLRKKNELTPAVGNVRVNARGDELGAGGKIIKKREDVVKDYYNNSSRPVADEPSHLETKVETPAPVVAETTKTSSKKTSKAQQKVEATKLSKEEQEMFDEWVEDEEGNFTKKDS